MARKKRRGPVHGWELYWLQMLYLTMETLHQGAFGEKGIFERIFLVEDEEENIMMYLAPHAAAEEMRGTKFEARVGHGEDAFLVGRSVFAWYLEEAPWGLSRVLGVNGGRPLSKRLAIALLALHECRHKARWHRKVDRVSPRTILNHLDGHIARKDHERFLKFWKKCTWMWRKLHGGKDLSAVETDAHIIEALGLYFWERYRTRNLSLLTEHFPSFVLLAPRT